MAEQLPLFFFSFQCLNIWMLHCMLRIRYLDSVPYKCLRLCLRLNKMSLQCIIHAFKLNLFRNVKLTSIEILHLLQYQWHCLNDTPIPPLTFSLDSWNCKINTSFTTVLLHRKGNDPINPNVFVFSNQDCLFWIGAKTAATKWKRCSNNKRVSALHPVLHDLFMHAPAERKGGLPHIC